MGLNQSYIAAISPRRWNIFLNISFIVCLLLILYNRCMLFSAINLSFIDSDQPYMWGGLKDYSNGLFYEPRFYGQDYNSFFEALVAVPLVWMNVPVYYALPLATHLISLFPFIFTATWLFFKNKKENALMVTCVLLVLPTGYDIMNSIPRGFVTGLFFCSFFIISLRNPLSIKYLVLNTTFVLLGYFIHPNSLLVSAPFLFYLFLQNYRKRSYYLATGACLMLFIPLHLIFNQFYIDHPSRVTYGVEYDFGLAWFLENISHLDQEFQHVSFFVEENCLTLLASLLLFGTVLFRHNKKAFYAFIVFIAVLLLSFFSGKARDGANWPFYSFSRMYLGIPIFMALFSAFLHLPHRRLMIVVVLVTFAYSALKFLNFEKKVAYHMQESHWLGVHCHSLKGIIEAANFYQNVCRKNNADRLVISGTFIYATFLANGGPAVYDDFPNTESTTAERRYWIREGNKNKVFKKFVLISINTELEAMFEKRPDFKINRLDYYGMYLVSNNTMPNGAFISMIRKIEAN